MIEHEMVRLKDLNNPIQENFAFRALDHSMRSYGFVAIWDDSFDFESQRPLFNLAKTFFAQPISEKIKFSNIDTYVPRQGVRGFIPAKRDAVGKFTQISPYETRLCESFNIRSEIDSELFSELPPECKPLFGQNVWPLLDGFQEAYGRYMRHVEGVGLSICRAFERGYGLAENSLTKKMRRSPNHLRINHYTFRSNLKGSAPVHFGAHTDFGLLGLLIHDGQPGLEIEVDGVWHEFSATPGAFVVNAGDVFSIVTNNVWKAANHRVREMPLAGGYTRTSIAFFLNGEHDWNLECLPGFCDEKNPWSYSALTVRQHMARKVNLLNSIHNAASHSRDTVT